VGAEITTLLVVEIGHLEFLLSRPIRGVIDHHYLCVSAVLQSDDDAENHPINR